MMPQKFPIPFFLSAFLAGACWISHYAMQVFYGVITRKVLFDAEETPFFRIDAAVFFLAYVTTGLALTAFAALLPANRRGLKYVARVFALVGALAGLTGLLFGSLLTGSHAVVSIAGKGILSLFVAALLVGFGAWRASDLPTRRAARCIALFGLLTMPLAMLFGMLEQTVPSYYVTELHFVVSGALWLAAGQSMAAGVETLPAPAGQTGA